jgi:hypothetical protein
MMKLHKFWVNGTRKVHPDDDEAIPWIAASKSSNQKAKITILFLLKNPKNNNIILVISISI